MSEHKSSETVMMKVARLIADKRNAFFLIFFWRLPFFRALSISKVQVNDDLTEYLSAESETRRGLDVMEKEFVTLGSANIMVSNITDDAA